MRRQCSQHHGTGALLVGRHDARGGLVLFWNRKGDGEADHQRDRNHAREHRPTRPKQPAVDDPSRLRRSEGDLLVFQFRIGRIRRHSHSFYSVFAATPAVIAIEAASWPVLSRFLQKSEPPIIFCGTTTTSPGLRLVARTLLPKPPEWRPMTEPLARIIKISLRLAVVLTPPARPRYHSADLPGANVSAVTL